MSSRVGMQQLPGGRDLTRQISNGQAHPRGEKLTMHVYTS